MIVGSINKSHALLCNERENKEEITDTVMYAYVWFHSNDSNSKDSVIAKWGKKVQSSLNLNYENLCLLFVITMKYYKWSAILFQIVECLKVYISIYSIPMSAFIAIIGVVG